MRKFIINVNGNSYEVEVEEVGAGQSVPAVSAPAAQAPAPKAAPAPKTAPAAAPAAAYFGTTSSGRASAWIQPFDGDFRLNSAMIPVGDSASAFFSDLRCAMSRGTLSPACIPARAASSCRFVAMISLKMSVFCK